MLTKNMVVFVVCLLMASSYFSFEFGRDMEKKKVPACLPLNGKVAVSQRVYQNGDSLCSYVRDITGLAVTTLRR